MRSLLTRAAVTALGTVLAVSLMVAAKSGPAGPPVALPAAGVIGRPLAPSGAVAAAPPQPETTTDAALPLPASSSTTVPTSTVTLPSTTTRPAPTSSTTVTTRALPRPAPTTATTARPTTTSAPPVTVPPTSTPPTTAPTTTTTTTAPSSATTTMDSPVFTASYGFETYGPVQVRLTLQGHRIVDAVALQTPSGHARSVQINSRAVPILRQEVLTAQSAQIDTVSGATATSQAYAQCIQAILDQAWK